MFSVFLPVLLNGWKEDLILRTFAVNLLWGAWTLLTSRQTTQFVVKQESSRRTFNWAGHVFYLNISSVRNVTNPFILYFCLLGAFYYFSLLLFYHTYHHFSWNRFCPTFNYNTFLLMSRNCNKNVLSWFLFKYNLKKHGNTE